MSNIAREPWAPCPQGELDRLEERLRLARFWRTVGTAVLVAAVVASVAVASWVVADAVGPWFGASSATCPAADVTNEVGCQN
jgi:hypothetical protein